MKERTNKRARIKERISWTRDTIFVTSSDHAGSLIYYNILAFISSILASIHIITF